MVPRESQGSAWNPDSPSPVTPVSAKASWPEIWRIWSPIFFNFFSFINFFSFFKFSLGFSYFLDLSFHFGNKSLRNGPAGVSGLLRPEIQVSQSSLCQGQLAWDLENLEAQLF